MRRAPARRAPAFHAIDASLEMKLRALDVPEGGVVVDHRARAQRHACARLHALAAERLGPGRVAVAHGVARDAASLILAEEGRTGADLVVIGQDGHSALASFLLGSVVQRVVRGARCDTLVVPRPSSRGHGTRRGECTVAGSVSADRWKRDREALREEAGEEPAPR